MDFIDTHCHLDAYKGEGEASLDAVLRRAAAAGVGRVITIGTESSDWAFNRTVTAQYANQVAFTVGLHPCEVKLNWEQCVETLPDFFKQKPMPVGLGEIGLDYFHLPRDPVQRADALSLQQAAFRAQLRLVREQNCPVVVHSRQAFDDCIRLIDEAKVDWQKVVFHCFSEGPEAVRVLNKRGGYASFTGILTFKNAKAIRQAALTQGLERLMIETDAPYLSPEPHRGKRNEPAFVRHTAVFAAQLFGVSLEEVASVTTANAHNFFGLV